MLDKLLPWQEKQWEKLLARRHGGRLPHALLLTGPVGMGKVAFAEHWVRGLLCESPNNQGLACGGCRGCQLLAAGSHPDYRWVAPPEEGKVIGVDQMRELIQYLTLTPQYRAHKIAAIHPAHKLNINAANSLLKTLEEPPSHSLIVLVTAQPVRLPVTIVSRCQRIHFSPPPTEQALAWLRPQLPAPAIAPLLFKLADGAPLRALALADAGAWQGREDLMGLMERLARGEAEPVAAAEAALKLGLRETLYYLYSWLCDLVRLTAAGNAAPVVNEDLQERLRVLAQDAKLQTLFGQLDQVTRGLQLADRQLNPQLLMEDTLLAWCGAFDQARAG